MPRSWAQEWTPTVKTAKPKAETATPKPYQSKMIGGINEEMASAQAKTQYDAGRALRQYQMDTAQRNLQQTLKTLDRSKMDAFKNVANDYGSRGLLRSGGYLGSRDKVEAGYTEQGNLARTSVNDLANQSQLEDIQALASLQGIDYNILQQYIAALMANKINQTGQA